MSQQEDIPLRDQPRDASLSTGMCVVFGTIVFGMVASLALILFTSNFRAQQAQPPGALVWGQTTPESLVPTHEEMFGPALLEVRKIEDDHLQNYGWVDPKLKVVRIPIDRAVEILLKQDAEAGGAQPDEKKP